MTPDIAPARRGGGATWEQLEARRQAMEAMTAGDTPRSIAPRDAGAAAPLAALDDTPYVELHLHSHYSLLEGASSIDELVATAVEQGHRALALTDHDALYGAMAFAQAAKAAGLRPITGLELTVGEADGARHHVTLLVETRAGYANLCRLSSLAFGLAGKTAEEREARRLDPVVPVDAIGRHAEGLILLTGCRGGPARAARGGARHGRGGGRAAPLGRLVRARQRLRRAPDNLVYGDRPRNRALVALAGRVGVGVVGTGDVHYHERGRHRLQDVLVSIQHRKTLDESHRETPPERRVLPALAGGPGATVRAVPPGGGRQCGPHRPSLRVRPHRGPRLPPPDAAGG